MENIEFSGATKLAEIKTQLGVLEPNLEAIFSRAAERDLFA
jgi:hypothetical protein